MNGAPAPRLRLAFFPEQIFWFDGERYATDEAFVRFLLAFRPPFERLVFYGRVAPERRSQPYALDPAAATVVPLPWYEDVNALGTAGPAVAARLWRLLRRTASEWDALGLYAPHPLSVAFAEFCRRRGKPFFLLVRQNQLAQVRRRNRGWRRGARLAAVWLLEAYFRRLAAAYPTFTVGAEMYRRYHRPGYPVHPAVISLLGAADVRGANRPYARRGAAFRLLSVGRLEPEKGLPHLLQAVRILAQDRGLDMTLDLVGNGREEPRLRQEAARLGLERRVRFRGYVAFGPDLWRYYEESDVFVLPSLSEGLPQVLLEAMAAGMPVLATRVGGIPDWIADGQNGLLAPPGDAAALAQALERLAADEALRRRLGQNGLRTAAAHTQEAEVAKILAALRAHYPGLGLAEGGQSGIC